MSDPTKDYATGVHPLSGYAAIVAAFNLLFAGFWRWCVSASDRCRKGSAPAPSCFSAWRPTG